MNTFVIIGVPLNEDMIVGDDEDGECSRPLDRKMEPRFFKETLKTLEQLAQFLACVKCDKLPMQRVYTLGGCTHKYCEKCVTGSAGRACVICKVTSYPKDAKPDLFSTSILSEIPAVYYAIARMEERGKEMNNQDQELSSPEKEENEPGGGGDEEVEDTGINSCDLRSIPRPFSPPTENSLKMISANDEGDSEDDDDDFEMRNRNDFKEQEDNDHEMEDEEIFAAELNEEVFENTPASRILPHSADPDFMEETPQNKTKTTIVSLSLGKSRRSSKGKMHPKVLDLSADSPEKEKKVSTKSTTNSAAGKCTDGKVSKTLEEKSPAVADETLISDEELFRSESASGGGVEELPVFTCHSPVAKGAPKQEKKVEKTPNPSKDIEKPENTANKGNGKVNEIPKGKPQNKFFKRDRTPGSADQGPPPLTPHEKLITFANNLKLKASHVGNKTSPFKKIKKSSERDLPVLTPQGKPKKIERAGKKRSRSEDDNSAALKDKYKEGGRKKSEVKLPTSTRSSPAEQEPPPSLTPHQKVNTDNPKKEVSKGIKLSTSIFEEPKETITPRSTRNTKKEAEKTPSTASINKPESKSRAKKPKLNISVSTTYTSDDDEYEFKPTPPTERTSSNKRRISATPSSKSSSVASLSFKSSKNNSVASLSLKNAGSGAPKEKRNAKGETALHVSCRAGQFDKVKKLVDEGADVNAVDNAGWTPLHEAISGKAENKQKANIVRFLCEKGSNVNVVGGPEDETPLYTAAAASCGLESIVELLLELGASPNIRNSKGRLPVDDASNEIIEKMLNERTSRGNTISSTSIESSSAASSSNYNSALTTVAEDDPAVIQVMLKKAVLYFNYEVERDVLEKVKTKLKLRVSDKLSASVTHIVHHIKEKDRPLIRVPFSVEYLFGLAHGMWQVSHDWIEKSIQKAQCLSPTAFEVSGTSKDAKIAAQRIPGKTRLNKETANPGLLDGFCFYLYKTCGYSFKGSENSSVQLARRELTTLIQAAGGKPINREPDPNLVDPLEAPQRFHANQSDLNQSPFALTSHIILYDDKEVPPKSKMYTMEHVKTLRSDWVIESISKFNLENPEKYLS